MSTNAGFNPPSDPPCDTTPMTATALVALRDAGGLDVRCHYFVLGPTIGTPGNTSATLIELHAVTPNTLSKEAKVSQTFNPEGAFIGSYDPDADTANGGTINELLDHWGNRLTDEDDGSSASHTIHNQWPYHLSGPLLRDNIVDDVTLPGLDAFVAAGGEFRDNELRETTIDLTGVTSPGPAPASFFRRNLINSGSVAVHAPTVYANNNSLNDSTITHDGTSAGSFSFQNNTMLSGSLTVDAATTAQVTFNANIVGGTTDGYRTQVVGKTAGTCIISGNRLYNASLGSFDLRAGGSGNISMTGCEVGAGQIDLASGNAVTINSATMLASFLTIGAAAGNTTITRLKADGSTLSHLGSGVLTSTDLTMSGNSVLRSLAGQSGNLFVSTSHLRRAYVFEVSATSTAAVTVSGSVFTGHQSTAAPNNQDVLVDGSGTRTITDSRFSAVGNAPQLVLTGGGSVSISGSEFAQGRLVRDAATTANAVIARTRTPGTLQQDAGATSGALQIDGCDGAAIGLLVQQRGPGRMQFNSCRLGSTVRNAATATRGVVLTSCDMQGGTFDQNRTGGTGDDSVSGLTLRSSLSNVTLAGATDPGGNQTPLNNVTVETGAQVTLTNPVGTGGAQVCLQNVSATENAVVTGTGTVFVTNCRFASGADVNLGAFTHANCVAENDITVNATANNTGKLANAAFNNWI